jgi:hypothetical protein
MVAIKAAFTAPHVGYSAHLGPAACPSEGELTRLTFSIKVIKLNLGGVSNSGFCAALPLKSRPRP